MNSDTVLTNIDLIDDHHFMQYFNTDQTHYMSTNNSAHMSMPQLVDGTSQNSMHYMPSKSSTNKSITSRPQMGSIGQGYSHDMNTMATMSTQMLGSPQMVPQMDQNNANNQMRYCKAPPVSVSNHFETPPLQPQYRPGSIQNHNSPTSNRTDINHFNESVNISNTLTHISETDNSNIHNNYVPTPPQSQPMDKHVANNLNMISTPQTYSSMTCHPSNNWSSMPSNIPNIGSQMKHLKNNNSNQQNYNSHHEESQFSYMEPRNTDYLSITSTPVSSQSQSDHYMIRSTKAANQNCGSKNIQYPSTNELLLKKSKLTLNTNCEMLSNSIKKDYILAEKRNVVIFKVMEQIIDPTTKNILKETISKNEEVILPLGHVQFDLLNNDTTNCSTMMTQSHVGSSGLLADISGLSNTKSVNNTSSTNSTDFQSNPIKSDLCFESKLNKSDIKLKTDEIKLGNTSPKAKSDNFIATQNSIDENDEEERRQTASALLSLQTVSNSNTPVKEHNDDFSKVNIAPNELNSKLSSLLDYDEPNTHRKISNDHLPVCARIKPGIKVMAKWKDKNFYPAEILKQVESHKWSVRFDDLATRNLFETEIIRIEYLLNKQDVMLTISDDLCIRASIKHVHIKSKNIDLDLEHYDDDKFVTKRYKLRDIFLNVEQSSNILAKMSKPSMSGAVFADVDLDNIVTGKRSRSTKTNTDTNNTNSKKKPNDSSSSDSDVSNNKKKRKINENEKPCKKSTEVIKISKDFSKKNDFNVIGHYHESSLSVSPRSSKSSLSMPASEIEKILGPLPKPGFKIFEKISFILTSGDRNKNIFSEQGSNPERSIPFDKNYLTKQITSGGGTVYDSFEEMKSSNESQECVLIADTYHRSIKYIQCLAAGIPIASHLWVIDSCRDNKLMERDSYILPAGYSVITHSLSSDKNTLKRSSVLFKGMKFYFGSKSADKLEKLWAPVLFAAQAIIVKQDPNMHNILTRKLVDIIIGDASCTAELVKRAKQMKIPIISSEYIVQCLINGRKLSYDACPFFSYSYK